MTQETDGKNRITSIGMAALGLAVLLFLSCVLEEVPVSLQGNLENNRSIDKITVFYWAVLFSYYVKLPIVCIILLLVCIIGNRLLDEVQQQTFSSATLSAVLLSLIAGYIVFWSVFFSGFSSYEHATSEKLGWHKYNLGVRTTLDHGSFYVVGKCDIFGIFCDCYGVAPVRISNGEEISRTLSLEQDAQTKIIYIKRQNYKRIPISK